MSNNKMQEKYLPFKEDVLIKHFAPVGKNANVNENHLIYYKKSIAKYKSYKKNKKTFLENLYVKQVHRVKYKKMNVFGQLIP